MADAPEPRWHQTSTYTRLDRYPKLFDDCRAYLGDSPARLLSSGCSTDEEVVSLGQRWTEATIVGVDINPWCVAECRQRHRSPRFVFPERRSAEFAGLHLVDAVFCLAVFQRPGNWGRRDDVIVGHTFEQFASEIAILDANLAVGGVLAIDNADFRFTDTPVADRYDALGSPNGTQARRRPLYGPDNRKIADDYVAERLYVKTR